MKTRRTFRFTALLCQATTLLSALGLMSVPSVHASTVFVNDSGYNNTVANWCSLQQPDANRSTLYFVTQNWDPGARGGMSDPHPVGVWFNNSLNNWAIFNEDLAGMPISAAFNVYGRPPADNVYVHTTTRANTPFGSNFTYIDNIYTNYNPGALIWVTPVWNPGGTWNGVYHNHNMGVWYDRSVGRWAIYNQDRTSMAIGVSFNVLIESGAYSWHYFVVQASGSTPTLSIDNIVSNGAPTAKLLVTPVWNPGGAASGVYNDHPIGVIYQQNGRWEIFNEDGANIPAGAAFNVWVLGL